MVGLNKIMVIGNIGAEPEMRFTANGTAVTSFPVAVSRNYTTPDGERRQETEWFRVITWDKLAETCNQFLSKGRRAYVEGRVRTHTWEGQDNQRRTRVEIIANTVLFLDRQPTTASLPEDEEKLGEDLVAEDLPF